MLTQYNKKLKQHWTLGLIALASLPALANPLAPQTIHACQAQCLAVDARAQALVDLGPVFGRSLYGALDAFNDMQAQCESLTEGTQASPVLAVSFSASHSRSESGSSASAWASGRELQSMGLGHWPFGAVLRAHRYSSWSQGSSSSSYSSSSSAQINIQHATAFDARVCSGSPFDPTSSPGYRWRGNVGG
jgi:hypothetical protein